jgi:WD40 repeat protein
MAKVSSLFDLETLFLEKLQEKYKLNIRDIKRAFSRFDLDNNGLLDLNEMTKGIQMFLNGVQESQVQELVSCYDLNGDGKISYEEFLQFLQTRSAIDPYDGEGEGNKRLGSADPAEAYLRRKGLQSPPQPPASERGGRQYANRGRPQSASGYSDASGSYNGYFRDQDVSEDGYSYPPLPPDNDRGSYNNRTFEQPRPGSAASRSTIQSRDANDPKALEYRAKIYLENLRAMLVKRATDMRMKGKVAKPVTMTFDSMHESVAREILTKAFQPFTGEGDGRARSRIDGIEIADFIRVLRSFQFPGSQPLRPETAQFIFDMCSHADGQGTMLNEAGNPVADVNFFVDLIFGHQPTRREQVERQRGRIAADKEDKQPATEHLTGLPLKSFPEKVNAGRKVVGVIPDRFASTTAGVDATTTMMQNSLAVPLRFLNRKSRTALATPSNFDAATAISRSNQLPAYDLVRRHVFGVSTTHYSGNTLFVLPPAARAGASVAGRPLSAGSSTSRTSADFLDPATILYTSAALGVVHDLSTNRQSFFNLHADDVTCVTINDDGSLAATGCVGKQSVILVWRTSGLGVDSSSSLVAEIGRGFFERGVNAVAFAYDSQYIVGVGCDDNSMLGVFHLRTGNKVLEVPAQHGIPPQLTWMRYCPGQMFTEWITREHAGPCDVFVTTGEHHLRIWSFVRPSSSTTNASAATLAYKGLAISQTTLKKKTPTAAPPAAAPKTYTCADFIACEDKTYDLVTGGSNGVVYLWRRGQLVTTQTLWRGKVSCLVIQDDRVYCGGAGGMVKLLDGRTLATLQMCALLGLSALPKAQKRPTSAKDVARAFARPSSTSSAAGIAAVSNRPRSATPLGTKRGAAGAPSAALHRPDTLIGRDDSGVSADEEVADGDGDDSGAKIVTGLAVVVPSAALGGRASVQHSYVLATLGTGKVVRVDLNHPRSDERQRASAADHRNTVVNQLQHYPMRDLFYYHVGAVYGLSADASSARRLAVSVGDDKKLMVWDTVDRVAIARGNVKSPSRCCALDRTNCFIAVGSTAGDVTVYFISDVLQPTHNGGNVRGGNVANVYRLAEVAYRKDGKSEMTCMSFSPANDKLAVGSRDDSIYVYQAQMDVVVAAGAGAQGRQTTHTPRCVLRAMHRLKGHSSTITHLDWSYDGRLLRSTCAAYELLCWDVEAGRLHTVPNALADTVWKTHHCILGFHVMGIWPPYADGTDINGVDVCLEKGIVATANDAGGLLRLLNYPSVVRHAPGKDYTGHSSHITSVRFIRGGERLVTSGGNDGSVMVFDVHDEVPTVDPAFR